MQLSCSLGVFWVKYPFNRISTGSKVRVFVSKCKTDSQKSGQVMFCQEAHTILFNFKFIITIWLHTLNLIGLFKVIIYHINILNQISQRNPKSIYYCFHHITLFLQTGRKNLKRDIH